MIRIPRRFYDDHVSRELPAPKILKETKAHYFIDPDDPAIPELLNDAEYYASEYRHMDRWLIGIGMSAVATVKALKNK